jgi:hypothetical protein
MTWNCVHLVKMLKAAGGASNQGNDRNARDDGERFVFENPTREVGS